MAFRTLEAGRWQIAKRGGVTELLAVKTLAGTWLAAVALKCDFVVANESDCVEGDTRVKVGDCRHKERHGSTSRGGVASLEELAEVDNFSTLGGEILFNVLQWNRDRKPSNHELFLPLFHCGEGVKKEVV